ncbi:hypothetical protein DPEC_G00223820 [Dallia pectoralis]|uniref:Uncharacterized protein n=1 Tax=Dallia pectoralis TaxID=75939 RepID=A0ACC2G0A4_DALPE|nr:hypothetical protein DPEC_G00223820 [Dallia pectoralis]
MYTQSKIKPSWTGDLPYTGVDGFPGHWNVPEPIGCITVDETQDPLTLGDDQQQTELKSRRQEPTLERKGRDGWRPDAMTSAHL